MNKIEIKNSRCNCHPETCCHGRYDVFLNGEKVKNCYDLQNAKTFVSQLEKAFKIANKG